MVLGGKCYGLRGTIGKSVAQGQIPIWVTLSGMCGAVRPVTTYRLCLRCGDSGGNGSWGKCLLPCKGSGFFGMFLFVHIGFTTLLTDSTPMLINSGGLSGVGGLRFHYGQS
jgi:hypothetical protein